MTPQEKMLEEIHKARAKRYWECPVCWTYGNKDVCYGCSSKRPEPKPLPEFSNIGELFCYRQDAMAFPQLQHMLYAQGRRYLCEYCGRLQKNNNFRCPGCGYTKLQAFGW